MTNSALIHSLFKNSLSSDSKEVLLHFDEIVQHIRPLNSRQLQQLPDNIRALSHQLTDERCIRRLGYMNDNIQLSSYVRYYTWWNLIRLTRLFANLPSSVFPSEDCTCLDLGSGPLTVVTALWLSRPELRKLKLSWYCLDVSANALSFGEDLFLSVAARSDQEPWKITRIKGAFGTEIKQKAGFVTCANMLNELDQASTMPPEFQSKKYYAQLKKYALPEASFCLVEPGVPKASRTLCLLRERFIADGKTVSAPCPHQDQCPMNGFKAYTGSTHKWCNFAFSTEDAPARLQKLSTAAKLPKERATLSFLAISGQSEKGTAPLLKSTVASEKRLAVVESSASELNVRITSDKLRLPNYMCGFYGCTKHGLALVKLPDENNTRLAKPAFRPSSGDLICVKTKTPDSLSVDQKSGAFIIEM